MKIVVCIKQVPDTTEIKLDPVTGTLIRDGVPSIMNPDDKGGLEFALQLKDQYGAHVTVITMGPPQAEAILREAYAMGVDRAILLSDRKFGGADTLATCRSLEISGIRLGDHRTSGYRRGYRTGGSADRRASGFTASNLRGKLDFRREQDFHGEEIHGRRLPDGTGRHSLRVHRIGIRSETPLYVCKRNR